MPVYEYVCKECGNHTEVSQSFKDEPLTVCPLCRGSLRKVFNSIGIVLKGSGFYRTDSRMPAKTEKGEKGEKADKKAEKDKAAATAGGESKAGDSNRSGETKASSLTSTSDSKSSSSSSSSSESKSTKSA